MRLNLDNLHFCFRQWKPKSWAGGGRFKTDFAFVAVNDGFDYEKPEAGADIFHFHRVARAKKFVENKFLIVGGDADAGVFDWKHHLVVLTIQLYDYFPVFFRVGDRVVNQII